MRDHAIGLVMLRRLWLEETLRLMNRAMWDWEKSNITSPNQIGLGENMPQEQDVVFEEEDSDDENQVIKGIRTLTDIYERCNVAMFEPRSVRKL
ncbi:unnamed protein product [Dovyalis caffra]|uniref:Uncharacterized protein n=1 Tax=Dovyalis caffra TaxID=77055 RepID=A0AAV1QVA3_9ROSI|nr:unnamed protein product [Dovyalis caffra]